MLYFNFLNVLNAILLLCGIVYGAMYHSPLSIIVFLLTILIFLAYPLVLVERYKVELLRYTYEAYKRGITY